VRPVKFGTERIAEAAKQGFTEAIVPAANVPRKKINGINVIGVRKLAEALAEAFT
jgi:DNA repair protein RadA/Sms